MPTMLLYCTCHTPSNCRNHHAGSLLSFDKLVIIHQSQIFDVIGIENNINRRGPQQIATMTMNASHVHDIATRILTYALLEYSCITPLPFPSPLSIPSGLCFMYPCVHADVHRPHFISSGSTLLQHGAAQRNTVLFGVYSCYNSTTSQRHHRTARGFPTSSRVAWSDKVGQDETRQRTHTLDPKWEREHTESLFIFAWRTPHYSRTV